MCKLARNELYSAMDRRRFITGLSIGAATVAGCAGDDSTSTDGNTTATDEVGTDATATVPYETFPDTETLLDDHAAALADRSFTATEYIEESSSSGRSNVTETTLRSAEAGALLASDDARQNLGPDSSQLFWFTGSARIGRDFHSYNPDGLAPPLIDRSAVTQIAEIGAFERVPVADDEAAAVAFAASGPSEQASDDSTDYRSIDVRMAVTATGYLQSIDAEITFTTVTSDEETQTVSYRYTVSDVGETDVSPPEFVDDALRIQGDIASDGSSVILEHAGGPAIEAGTALMLVDNDGFTREYNQPTLPSAFTEGDVAYVYWTGEGEAAISVGNPPSTVARDIALTSADGNNLVYVTENRGSRPERFEVRIDRQA